LGWPAEWSQRRPAPDDPVSATVPTWTTIGTTTTHDLYARGRPQRPRVRPVAHREPASRAVQGANFFGARQSIPSTVHHAQSITRLLERADGPTREALLRTGALVAEFLGWLFQDLGDFRTAAYWSDRSMEWAQEAADDHLQSYVLYRKSHQAASQGGAQKAVALPARLSACPT